jgi:hypothetical protein
MEHCTACYDRAMLRVCALASLLPVIALLPWSAGSAAAQVTASDLARARTHYNDRQFDEAIAVATAARTVPETADAAAIVLARAHLERYRERADPADLGAARAALRMVRTSRLELRDTVELILAFGESLFLEDDFGAAAEMFESGLERSAVADPGLHDAMLDWWGSAVERHASGLVPDEREGAFRRLAARMKQELEANPASLAAGYWTVVAFRGAGDLRRAWDAAVAAWVRSRLAGDRAPALRADVDRIVTQGIIPDRVRYLASDQRPAAESQLKAEWELVKEKWR